MVYLAESAVDTKTRIRAHRSELTDLEQLGDEIAELAAHLHAATHRLLIMLREFDERGGWSGGFRSCAHWLSWRTGIGLGAAREKVRVARALAPLPRLGEAMGRGELSFAKVRALTRVATPDREKQLLELARHSTASQLERIVRAWRRVDRLEEQDNERERHRRRELTLHIDDDGMYVLHARLDPEAGALLERALAAAGEALYGRRSAPADGKCRSGKDGLEPITIADGTTRGLEQPRAGQRRADAIGLIAECALRNELASTALQHSPTQGSPSTVGRGDRFQVVVHVDADALRESGDGGQSVLDGTRVSAETSRRLSCDASRVVMVQNAEGRTIAVGRRTRTIPQPIRRALEHRDRGCRFPGCGLGFCDAHHITHWADGGATRLDNLAMLCRRHHRAVHEEGFRIVVTPNGEFTFYRPDGKPLPNAPAAPGVPNDPAPALAATHNALGLAINASTALSNWRGERLDLDYAILTWRRT
jgi:uncharacterized protein DUF222/HNH endonuclease